MAVPLPNCGVSTNDAQLFQFSTGIQHLAETRHFKLNVLILVLLNVIRDQSFEIEGIVSRQEIGLVIHTVIKPSRTVNIAPLMRLPIGGFKDLCDRTNGKMMKAWFLDQFGVLHDGKKPYPGAISTLEKLAKSGVKMVVISNSSRRASVTYEKMRSMGFDPSLFLGAITSGELTHQYLERRDDSWFASLGRSCIHMTWNERGAISLDGLGLKVVDNIEDAEFILAHGTEALGMPSGSAISKNLDDLEKILEQCAARKIPMVVANPDYVTVEARDLRVMPGTLAAKYEQLGGEVKWMGKPGKIIYESAMAMAGVDASESVAVGDSLHHDIKGANAAGMQSIFITGGIHATELALDHFGQVAEASKVRDLASKCDAYPTFVVPAFTW